MNAVQELTADSSARWVLYAKDTDSTRVYFDFAELGSDSVTGNERLTLYRECEGTSICVGETTPHLPEDVLADILRDA